LIADGNSPLQPELSVIVPCLNVEHVLPTQLEALARQDCPEPWEVVIVDNGSVDRTRAVARSFSARFEGLRLVLAERRGRHHACNAGARAAQGRYLVFVDGDDEVAPGFLAAMYQGLQHHDLVGGKLEHRHLNGAGFLGVTESQSDGLLHGLGFAQFAMGANLGVRRDVFDRLGGFGDKPYCEDVDFCWRAQRQGIQPVFLPEAAVHYRQRSTPLAMFRQHRKYGAAQALLYRDFRAFGMPRRSTAEVMRDWLAIGKTLMVLVRTTHHARIRWVRRLARAVGRISGSVRYGVFYP